MTRPLFLSVQEKQELFKSSVTKEYRGHRDKVCHLAWSNDGLRLASSSLDSTVKVWLFDQSSIIGSRGCIDLKGHTSAIYESVWDPKNPERLATASLDRTARIWDAKSGKSLHRFDTSAVNIHIAWSPDGNYIAVGGKEDAVNFIDLRKLDIVDTYVSKEMVNGISWSPSGNLFCMTTGKGNLIVNNFPSLSQMTTLQVHGACCNCISFDPFARYFATGGADAIMSLWSADDYLCVRSYGRMDWPVRQLGFSYDGEYLAAVSKDLFIDITDVDTGEVIHSIKCAFPMSTVAWHPSRLILAYAGEDVDTFRPAGHVIDTQRPTGNLKLSVIPETS